MSKILQQEILHISPEQIRKKVRGFRVEVEYLKDILTDQTELVRLANVEQRVARLEKIMEKYHGENSN